MLSPLSLSATSIDLLQLRGLSEQQVDDFAALLDKASDQLEQNNRSAKQVLSALSADELKLLQQATSLADPIRVDSLSNEGAINLLAQPDKTGMVDLNNDGLVEIGIGKMITFPPVNAPVSVHQAWDAATEGMSFLDKGIMQMRMHIAIHGVQIEGQPRQPRQPAPAPEQQWSADGWQQLLDKLMAALDFSVAQDGWTRSNIVARDFYNKFDNALASANTEPLPPAANSG